MGAQQPPRRSGSITDEITKEITSSFSVIDTHQNMLSCYAIVEKGMLDLGPVWLDGYVRTCMVEGMAQAMEKAAISGTRTAGRVPSCCWLARMAWTSNVASWTAGAKLRAERSRA